jgi:hypothetical protein
MCRIHDKHTFEDIKEMVAYDFIHILTYKTSQLKLGMCMCGEEMRKGGSK